MAVDRQRRRDLRVPEPFLNHLRLLARFEEQSRGGVPEVMEPHPVDAGGRQEPAHHPTEVLTPQRPALAVREDERADRLILLGRLRLRGGTVASEGFHGDRRQRHRPTPGRGLGRAFVKDVPHFHDLAGHDHHPAVGIDVLPPQPEQFPLP